MFNIPKKAASYSDEALLAQFRKSGDAVWLGYIFERYIAWVYGVCLNYFDTTEEAEDAAMGIFEELHSKLPLHDISNLKSWLYSYAKNYCLMQLRSRRRAERRAHNWQTEQAGLLEEPEQTDEAYTRQLEDCIQQLPEQQRQSIRLFYYEEQSYQEIAAMFEQPLGLVRSYIQNGRRNLRNCMEKK